MSDTVTVALQPLNDFALSGPQTDIHYWTSSFDGRPRLSYAGPAADGPRAFTGGVIQALDTALGTEVSVALDLVLDGAGRTLTVVLPSFRSDGREERFETFAVVTTNTGSPGGAPAGPRARYEVVPLAGVARAVDS